MKAIHALSFFLSLLPSLCFAEPPASVDQQSFLEGSQLLVDGTPTDFATKPVGQLKIRSSHPRLMFSRSELVGLRAKLASSFYAAERTHLASKGAQSKYGGASIQAFRWQVFGDAAARDWAKDQLLNGNINKWGHPFYDNQWVFAWATTYDWLSDSLTQEEREIAWRRVKDKMGGNIAGFANGSFASPFEVNHNDSWGKTRYPYEPAVALAIYGDGIDDELARHILEKAVAGHKSFLSPYVMLDWLNLMALDSGGSQSEHAVSNVAGYAGMYAFPCMLYHGYWESATGENLWNRSNFFRFFPLWNVYDNDSPLGSDGQAIMEVVAGRYRESAPDLASLAAWYRQKYAASEIDNTFLLPRLIWGDKRVQPKSPAELGLPLASHLRGADCFVSRSSWDDDATVVNVATRTLDHLRYEPAPGVVSIYAGRKPILVDTRKGKWRREPVTASGATIGRGVGSMYWGPPHQWQQEAARPQAPLEVASHPAYHPDCTQEYEVNDIYHSIRVRYDHLSLDPVTTGAFRTVVHLYNDPQFVVVIDQWNAASDTGTLINWRLPTIPTVTEDTFVCRGASATVLNSGDGQLQWVGGVGHELDRLGGSWAGDKKHGYKPGYGKTPWRAERMGLGNVYLSQRGPIQCVTVIAIGATEPPTVTRRGDNLEFSGYKLLLKDKAMFDLSRQDRGAVR